MSWDDKDRDSARQYMNDLKRHPMLSEAESIVVGRRARLGYGVALAVLAFRVTEARLQGLIEAGDMNAVSFGREATALSTRLAALRRERWDGDPAAASALWPDSERWMAGEAEEALRRLEALAARLGEARGVEGAEALAAALADSTGAANEIERDFERLIQVGNDAVDALTRANLRFVINIGKRYQHRSLSLSEIISAGNEGLMKGARKYDERKGVRFVSYAAYWVKQQIRKELDYTSGDVKPSLTQQGRNRSVQRVVRAARAANRSLSVEEIQEQTEFRFSAARIQEALDTDISVLSLDAPADRSAGASAPTLASLIGASDADAEAAEEAERAAVVRKVLREVLDEREHKIILLWMGIAGHEEWSLADIGEAIGISRERVRQIKDRALEKIASSDYADLLLEAFGVRQPASGSLRDRVLSGSSKDD